MRSTRTRRQTRRPDYVYNQDFDDDVSHNSVWWVSFLTFFKDDGDEYKYQDDEDDEDNLELGDDEIDAITGGRRRSQRTATRNANGKRSLEAFGDWRGERRSTRLNTNPDGLEGSSKRARTEERSISSAASDTMVSPVPSGTLGTSKKNGSSGIRDNEVVVEQVAGKKKSKYWYYAVEPASEPTPSSPAQSSTAENLDLNELKLNGKVEDDIRTNGHQNDDYEMNGVVPETAHA